jgi:hypothetical protein
MMLETSREQKNPASQPERTLIHSEAEIRRSSYNGLICTLRNFTMPAAA